MYVRICASKSGFQKADGAAKAASYLIFIR